MRAEAVLLLAAAAAAVAVVGRDVAWGAVAALAACTLTAFLAPAARRRIGPVLVAAAALALVFALARRPWA